MLLILNSERLTCQKTCSVPVGGIKVKQGAHTEPLPDSCQ